MPSILLRIPESLLAELDQTAEETYQNRSSLIRASIARNLDIIRTVERPAILAHFKNRIPNLHL
jgi:metal-responsive CopG/Arc/MetJ family transcriptional regulator